jgi:hypothetical protein
MLEGGCGVAEQGRTWRRSEWAELERRDASGARWWRWSCSTRCATSGGGGGRDAADLDMANLTVSVMRKGVSAAYGSDSGQSNKRSRRNSAGRGLVGNA